MEVDLDDTAFSAPHDLHLGLELARQALRRRRRVRLDRLAALAARRRAAGGELLHPARREPFAHRTQRELQHLALALEREERTRLSGGELARAQVVLDRRRETEEPERV